MNNKSAAIKAFWSMLKLMGYCSLFIGIGVFGAYLTDYMPGWVVLALFIVLWFIYGWYTSYKHYLNN